MWQNMIKCHIFMTSVLEMLEGGGGGWYFISWGGGGGSGTLSHVWKRRGYQDGALATQLGYIQVA